jgi:hypothetical protein
VVRTSNARKNSNATRQKNKHQRNQAKEKTATQPGKNTKKKKKAKQRYTHKQTGKVTAESELKTYYSHGEQCQRLEHQRARDYE